MPAGGRPVQGGRRLIDLSHEIYDGLVTYAGLPAPVIDEHLTREASREKYAAGTEFSIGRITMVGNTGTYMDSPFHRYAEGADLAALQLERLVDLPAIVVRATDLGRAVDVQHVAAAADVRGKAVLIHTGWDRHWDTPEYAHGHAYVTAAAAAWLADGGAAIVGIDSFNIDDVATGERPAHTTLLRAGIPIVEHLTKLGELPDNGFRVTAVPPRVRAMGTWPVRAYAVID
jgi:kynurenine formamidase